MKTKRRIQIFLMQLFCKHKYYIMYQSSSVQRDIIGIECDKCGKYREYKFFFHPDDVEEMLKEREERI